MCEEIIDIDVKGPIPKHADRYLSRYTDVMRLWFERPANRKLLLDEIKQGVDDPVFCRRVTFNEQGELVLKFKSKHEQALFCLEWG